MRITNFNCTGEKWNKSYLCHRFLKISFQKKGISKMILKIHLDRRKPTRQYYQNINEGIKKKKLKFLKKSTIFQIEIAFYHTNEEVGIETKGWRKIQGIASKLAQSSNTSCERLSDACTHEKWDLGNLIRKLIVDLSNDKVVVQFYRLLYG